MKGDFFLPAQCSYFLYGFYCPYFVVAVHDGYKDGFRLYCFRNLVRADYSVFINRHGGYLVIHQFKTPQAPQDGIVLDIGCYDVPSLFNPGKGHALDRVIYRFGPARGKNDFFEILGINKSCNRFPCVFKGSGRTVPQLVLA